MCAATVVTDDPQVLLARRPVPRRAPGSPRAVFLVAPADWSLALESAVDNRYVQTAASVSAERALQQHHGLHRALCAAGIPTLCFAGDPAAPDGVFPNNVFATSPGRVIVGAMRHAVRRREAQRADLRAFFCDVLRYELIDLSTRDLCAELTGSLVIDRARKIGYCGLSERCDEAGAEAMAAAFDLDLVLRFELAPGEYHTNVVMSALGGHGVALCPEGFADPRVPAAIEAFYGTARSVRLSVAEKNAYAANCIVLGQRQLWLSCHAETALRPATIAAFERLGLKRHAVALDEFEKAGGSLRCMIGEIY